MLTVSEALVSFYQKHGFGSSFGARPPLTVKVYTGCMLVPLPNIETRRKYLKYHDVHHVITGFSVGRIGEGKVSAWELGTGTFYRHPILAMMNLIALSTGLFLAPKDMWNAFLLGKKSKHTYTPHLRDIIDRGEITLASLREQTLLCKEMQAPEFAVKLEYAIYCALAMIIHMALVLPAMALRMATDFVKTGSVIETITPKKRTDLY